MLITLLLKSETSRRRRWWWWWWWWWLMMMMMMMMMTMKSSLTIKTDHLWIFPLVFCSAFCLKYVFWHDQVYLSQKNKTEFALGQTKGNCQFIRLWELLRHPAFWWALLDSEWDRTSRILHEHVPPASHIDGLHGLHLHLPIVVCSVGNWPLHL